MMTKRSLAEAVAGLRAVLAALREATLSNTSTSGADLTYATNLLAAEAPGRIAAGNVGSAIQNCFTLAIAAGATLAGMTAVYTAADDLVSLSKPAKTILAACKSFAVIAITRIVKATTFTSREDIDSTLVLLSARFASVEAAAGAALLTDLYQALVTLRGAITATLTTASYPLPRLISYSVGSTVSALTLAQRLYGNASRAGELAAENKVFHPAFMPLAGRALSA